jgi:hypothetical protein
MRESSLNKTSTSALTSIVRLRLINQVDIWRDHIARPGGNAAMVPPVSYDASSSVKKQFQLNGSASWAQSAHNSFRYINLNNFNHPVSSNESGNYYFGGVLFMLFIIGNLALLRT